MMFLRSHPDYDFEMVYYNSDGAPSSMCGNGGRCIVKFAADLGMTDGDTRFLAVDGPHQARPLANHWVSLEMAEVKAWYQTEGGAYIMDTGSPHYVTRSYDPSTVDVAGVGGEIRNSEPYAAKGINVNFIREVGENKLLIATYERGVEGETLACGTGVTAAVLSTVVRKGLNVGANFRFDVVAKGGELAVRGKRIEEGFTDVWLEGPAEFVFKGEIALQSTAS